MKLRHLLPSLALLLAACATDADRAAPALPAEGKTYLVFFSFDKSDITPEAEETIGQAAADAKKSGAHIVLAGHADSAGSSDYNRRLSESRAVAVRAALVRAGVAESAIQAVGEGEGRRRTPIVDGIRERRVEISLFSAGL
ncbi:MAG: OmpA family protein [Alphaproteobacteria bacterium]|nr:OmpA family protein [Alphaproteobacteria bacterium]